MKEEEKREKKEEEEGGGGEGERGEGEEEDEEEALRMNAEVSRFALIKGYYYWVTTTVGFCYS